MSAINHYAFLVLDHPIGSTFLSCPLVHCTYEESFKKAKRIAKKYKSRVSVALIDWAEYENMDNAKYEIVPQYSIR